MAVAWVHAVLELERGQWPDLARRHRDVLLALADSADRETGEAWPSQAELARRSWLGERQLRTATRELQQMGVLEVEPRTRRDGGRGANLYRLWPGLLEGADQPKRLAAAVAAETGEGVRPAKIAGGYRPPQGRGVPVPVGPGVPAPVGPGLKEEEPSEEPSIEPGSVLGKQNRERVESMLAAYNRGARQTIEYEFRLDVVLSRLAAKFETPAECERVARFYADTCAKRDATPSLRAFSENVNEWKSRERSKGGAASRARFCRRHPGTGLERDGTCRMCEAEKFRRERDAGAAA